MRLEDLKKNLRKVTVKVNVGTDTNGVEQLEELNFVYRPSELTPDMTRKLDETLQGTWKAEWSLRFLCGLLAEWDLLDGDAPYPITFDNLALLPDFFLGQVIQAISADMGKVREGLAPS